MGVGCSWKLDFLGRVMLVPGRGMLREQEHSGKGATSPCISDTQRVRSNLCLIKSGFARAHTAGYDCKIKEFKQL